MGAFAMARGTATVGAMLLLCAAGDAALPRAAAAATLTWQGDVGPNWNDGVVGVDTNWTDGVNQVKPQDGDILVFPAGGGNPTTVVNDIAGLDLQAIQITGVGLGGAPYVIQGEGVTLGGPAGLLVNAPLGGDTFGSFLVLPIALRADLTLTNAGAGPASFNRADLNGFTLTVKATGGNVSNFGGISGTGALVNASGLARLILMSPNSYAGPTRHLSGFLEIRDSASLGASGPGNETVIEGGAPLIISGSVALDEAFTFNGAGAFSAGMAVTQFGYSRLAGPITLNGATAISVDHAAGVLEISGAISGDTGQLRKRGLGALLLSNPGNKWGETIVFEGALRLGATGALAERAPLTLHPGTTFDLNGANATIGLLTSTAPDSAIVLGAGTLTISQAAGFSAHRGTIAGSGGLTLNAPGLGLGLEGSVANSFTGTTTVLAGQLSLTAPPGIIRIPGDLVIGDGVGPSGDAKVTIGNNEPVAPTSTVRVQRDGVFDTAEFFIANTFGTMPLAALVIDDGVVTARYATRVLVPRSLAMRGGSILLVSGSRLLLNGNASASSGAQPATITGLGTMSLGGATRTFAVDAGGAPTDLAIDVPIAGVGGEGIIKTGSGVMVLSRANTHAGPVAVDGGTLRVSLNGALHGLNTIDVRGGTLDVGATMQFVRALRLIDGRILSEPAGRLEVDGPTPVDARKGTIAARLGSVSGLRKTTAATVILSGSQTFNAPIAIDAGTLLVNGTLTGPGTQLNGGLLGGSGLVPPIEANGGTVAPGESPGVLRAGTDTSGGWTGGVELTAGATLAVELNGLAPGSGYDQLVAMGPARLGGAALTIAMGFAPPSPSPSGGGGSPATFTIVANDGVDPVDGTFADLPEGALFSRDGRRFSITYAGGDGNDVVLTDGGPAAITYFLAEGATGAFFDDDVLIANPHEEDAPVTLTFFLAGGGTIAQSRVIPARARVTVHVDQIPGLEAATASAQVVSERGLPLAVERSMFWDATYYGGHTAGPVTALARRWLFAEGAQGFFSTFVLLVNPSDAPTDVTVTFFRELESPVVTTMTLAAASRFTVDTFSLPELAGRSFGILIESAAPIGAERAMYFGTTAERLWSGGHATAGIAAPADHWFHVEGATGGFFDTFILLSNPQDAPARVTLEYLLESGEVVTTTKTVEARGRLTVNVEADGDDRLRDAALSTRVSSDLPIVSERSMYWAGETPPWGEAHNSAGLTELGTRWGLAEGRVGGPRNFHTYVLLANPQTMAADVTVTWLRESGPPIVKTYTVPRTSRFTVDVNTLVPELRDEAFGARVEVTNGQPIAVERSMYWDANGIVWAGGTNATATRLPAQTPP